ncbi:MAG: glycoside hydrolase family 16 protein [[Clostridium] fimetarium]|nr:glycoside hydrolase family 16 protein [Alistipes timonensis]MCM1405212.1 glycoside hydrolase family 16 protein [[Clostridium] fimetarium]
MKSLVTSIISLAALFAASAEPVLYEASLTDRYGTPSANEEVTLRLTLLDAEGRQLYAETHSVTSDALGQLRAMVGSGSATEGEFNDANWESAANLGVVITRADGSEIADVANLGYTPAAIYAKSASALVGPATAEGRYRLAVDDAGNLSTVFEKDTSIAIPVGYTRLIFHDEFDGEGLPDPTIWSFEHGNVRNGEYQYYTKNRLENCCQADGVLRFTTIKEDYTDPETGQTAQYTSASVTTQNTVKFTYGRVDVRAKLPAIKGTWPAIWLMPNDSYYGMWPRSGEIDIMENVGYDPNVVHFTAHTYLQHGGDNNKHHMSMRVMNPTPSDDFHVYSLEWSENKLTWLVDGKRGFTMVKNSALWTGWPFDRDFYLILNLAWGGSWGGQQGIESEKLPVTYEVDYVRIFQ